MAKRILVPLDRSEQAEAVLPIVAKDVLAVGPAGAGILRSAMAAGGLAAALALTHVPITRHAGLPPTRGEKWVLSQWVRSKAPG